MNPHQDTPNHHTAWRKSSRSDSNTGQCVEVGALDSAIALRDSKLTTDTGYPYLTIPKTEWAALLAGIKPTR